MNDEYTAVASKVALDEEERRLLGEAINEFRAKFDSINPEPERLEGFAFALLKVIVIDTAYVKGKCPYCRMDMVSQLLKVISDDHGKGEYSVMGASVH